jgi:hypothetical protein
MLSHNTALLSQLQAADMIQYCKYQAQRFKELATVSIYIYTHTLLDKLTQWFAVTGHN